MVKKAIIEFDLDDFSEYIDLNRLQYFQVAINETIIAISTNKYLLLVDGTKDEFDGYNNVKIIIEFNEDSGISTSISWITDEIVGIGFESGLFICINLEGKEVFDYKGHNSSLQSIKLSSVDVNGKGPGIWLLYESGYLISIPLKSIPKRKYQDIVSFKFASHNQINDFIFMPYIYQDIADIYSLDSIETHENLASHSVIVGGFSNTLSIYNLGGRLHFQDFDKLSNFVKEKVGGYFSRSINAFFSAFSENSSGGYAQREGMDDILKIEERAITLVSQLDFIDEKRRIIRMSIEPNGKLVACADSLGRVTLYETGSNLIIRIWKGLRDARLSWTHHTDLDSITNSSFSFSSSISSFHDINSIYDSNAINQDPSSLILSLIIYAPLLGLVSIYKMSNGPCLRIIPVGVQCQLLNHQIEIADHFRIMKTLLLRRKDEDLKLELIEIDPTEQSETDIDLIQLQKMENESDPNHYSNEDFETGSIETSDIKHSDPFQYIKETIENSKSTNLTEKSIINSVVSFLNHLVNNTHSIVTSDHSAIDIESERSRHSNILEEVEHGILELLGNRSLSTTAFLKCLFMIENIELMGVLTPIDPDENIHIDIFEERKFLSDINLTQVQNPIVFSTQFHGNLISLLSESIEHLQTDGHRFELELLKTEIRARKSLLKSYKTLLEINSYDDRKDEFLSSSENETMRFGKEEVYCTPDRGQRKPLDLDTSLKQASISTPPSIKVQENNLLVDETAMICRQNTNRAEALCWALKAAKNLEKSEKRNPLINQSLLGSGKRNSDDSQRRFSLSPININKFDRISIDSLSKNRNNSIENIRSHTKRQINYLQLHGESFSTPPSDRFHPVLKPVGSGSIPSSSPLKYSEAIGLPYHLTNKFLADFFDKSIVSFTMFRAFQSVFNKITIPYEYNSPENKNHVINFVKSSFSHRDILSSFFRTDELLALVLSANQLSVLNAEKLLHNSRFNSSAGNRSKSTSPLAASPISLSGQPNSTSKNKHEILRKNDISLSSLASIESMESISLNIECLFGNFFFIKEKLYSFEKTLVNDDFGLSNLRVPEQYLSLKWTPSSLAVPFAILSFIVAPLIDNIVSLNSFINATRPLGLSGPNGLRNLLPLFQIYLAHQPMSLIISEVLTKKISSSPFQRWLRDSLLTMQDIVSQYSVNNDVFQTDNAGNENEDEYLENKHLEDDNSMTYEDDIKVLIEIKKEINAAKSYINHSVVDDQPFEDPNPESLLDDFEDSTNPSFDEFVRHSLRPAWNLARQLSNLESVLAFASIVLEILYSVNDQVERRTYGASNLKKTITAWENLIRQVRTTLLLRSRYINEFSIDFTVENISEGTLSLHRILALDTLAFALRPDHAIEHEMRCQEVYNHRVTASSNTSLSNEKEASAVSSFNSTEPTQTSTTQASSHQSRSDILLAWGYVADKRWRDLIAVAIAEDSFEAPATPELLHKKNSYESPLGTLHSPKTPPLRRNFSASGEKQSNSKKTGTLRKRKPLLLFFPHHNQLHYLGSYRCLILAERWSENYKDMELLSLCSQHLFGLANNWKLPIAADIFLRFVLPFLKAFVSIEENPNSLKLVNGDNPVDVRRHSELLSVISDVGLIKAFVKFSIDILEYIEAGMIKKLKKNSDLAEGESNDHSVFMNEKLVSIESENSIDLYEFKALKSYRDESELSTWPSTKDRFLQSLNERFYATDINYWCGSIFEEFISILLVMQLRFQCILRGAKPSRILGLDVLRKLDLLPVNLDLLKQEQNEKISTEDLLSIRIEFLEQCTKRLINIEPISIVIKLSQKWKIENNVMNIIIINALLETGTRDDEVEQIIPQVSDIGLVVDNITSLLRKRIGMLVARIEMIPSFGPSLASMDAEALSWSRKSVSESFTVDPKTLEDISKGKIKPVNINLASTRHLVICLQSLLLSVPVKDRYSNSKSQSSTSWLDRKGKCDALLSLCNSFSSVSFK